MNPYYNYSNGYAADLGDNKVGEKATKLNEILTISDIRNESGNTVSFIAFVNSFSQNFVSNWNKQEALGRMDDIATFKNTTRTISVSWDIPAADFRTAKENLNRCNALISMLYPTYTKSDTAEGGSYIMSKPPLVRVKYANLIANTQNSKGLKGYITSLTWAPVLEMGSFHNSGGQQGLVYPKVINITMEFTALHEPIGKGGPTGYFEGASSLNPNKDYGDRPSGTSKGWPFGMPAEANNRPDPVLKEEASRTNPDGDPTPDTPVTADDLSSMDF